MLYKFKSRATGDLIMLEPAGRHILQIIGKPLDPPQGIIQPHEMPAAIAAIEAAIAEEERAQREAANRPAPDGQDLPEGGAITLRQRAQPFVDMLRRAHEADREVVWGV